MHKITSYSFYLIVIGSLFFYFLFQSQKENLPYDTVSESLVVGRMLESERSGIFSYAGLTGMLSNHSNDDNYKENSVLQFDLIEDLNKRESYAGFTTYDSQTGGQGMLYSLFNNLSPYDLTTNISILQTITLFINSVIFAIFIGWCRRNFGYVPSFIVFLGILLSSWIWLFSNSLWWCLWAFYLPFLTLLLGLEKNINKEKLYLLVYFAFIIKCFFNGFEYITTTILAGYSPIIFYFLKERKSFPEFLVFSIKTGTMMLLAVLTEMSLLIYQLTLLKGSFKEAFHHILFSYETRTADVAVTGKTAELVDNMYLQILLKYLAGDAFSWFPTKIPFIVLIIIIFLAGILLLKKQKALVITTFASILAPLSWYLLFVQHSNIHYHLNYIIWYLPFLLYGFLCVGVFFNSFLKK